MRPLLQDIRRLRAENNDFWMELVQLALKYAPAEEINPLIIEISKRDVLINKAWDKLRK